MNEEIKRPAILQRIQSLNELMDKLERKIAPVCNIFPVLDEAKTAKESLAMERLGILCDRVESLTSSIDIN
jgi:hypothetical protein